MKEFFSVAAGLLFVLGFLPYIRAILKGETKPAKATWLVWASLDTVALVGMIAEGVVNGQILGIIVGAWTVALLALKYGTPGWTKLDKFCIVGAVLGIILWQVFSSPLLGMLVSLGVMFLASFPTFLSAWEDPGREDKTAWIIF